jgi:hypothetical protein
MKNNAAKAATYYLRGTRKGARKIRSAKDEIQAKAKLDGEFAALKAKAAELPALQAQNERLRDQIERFYLDIAVLAALISPQAFAGNRDGKRGAIRLALKRLRDVKEILQELQQESEEKEKQAVADAKRADLSKVCRGYQHAVKLITGETKNWDRALGKWKRYVAARKMTPGSDLETVLGQYRERWEQRGWTALELIEEIREFSPWWKQEKSVWAKKAAKKRGRVKRPKSDLRFNKNRRRRQGYCRKCGARIRLRERLCDKCVSGKPLLIAISDKENAEGEILSAEERLDTLSFHQEAT